MIRFTCRCGQAIEVDDDLAGGDVQCTACGLLNSVPTLSELSGLAVDGGYKIDDQAPIGLSAGDRLRTLHRAYSRNTTEADGSEIDNRVTAEELAGAGEIPLADEGSARPRYDPVTGELIRPLDLAPQQVAAADAIPMAKPAISYATAAERPGNFAGAAALLTSPGNIAVIGFMFLLCLICLAVLIVANTFFFVGVFALIVVFAVVGHLSNIIDEIGPRDMDDLPRPFRDLQIGEDIWMPFVHVVVAFALSYGPLVYVLTRPQLPELPRLIVISGLLAYAVVSLPAMLITMSTSGSIHNLRPDRVVGVMRANIGSYLLTALVGVLGLFVFFWGFIGINDWMATRTTAPWWLRPYVVFPVLFVGVYLMHLFAWQCGMYYRGHYASFAWVYQRHVKVNKHNAVPRTGQGAADSPRGPRRPPRQAPRPGDRRW